MARRRRFQFRWELIVPRDGKPRFMCANLDDQLALAEGEHMNIEVRRYPASLTTSIKLTDEVGGRFGNAFFKLETKRNPNLSAPLEFQVYQTWEKLLLQKVFEMRAEVEIDLALEQLILENALIRKGRVREQPVSVLELDYWSPRRNP